jgi:hypothetical protein
VSNVEELLRPYVVSSTIEEAERALDLLADEATAPPRVLGDCYDELASGAADAKDLGAAVRLERKAIASGCSDRWVAREMLAWYLLEGDTCTRARRSSRSFGGSVRVMPVS